MKGAEDIKIKIEIEKNIPIPPKGLKQAKYPFREMGIGDSFVAKKGGPAPSAATRWGWRNNAVFLVRTLDETTIRIWRTA